MGKDLLVLSNRCRNHRFEYRIFITAYSPRRKTEIDLLRSRRQGFDSNVMRPGVANCPVRLPGAESLYLAGLCTRIRMPNAIKRTPNTTA